MAFLVLIALCFIPIALCPWPWRVVALLIPWFPLVLLCITPFDLRLLLWLSNRTKPLDYLDPAVNNVRRLVDRGPDTSYIVLSEDACARLADTITPLLPASFQQIDVDQGTLLSATRYDLDRSAKPPFADNAPGEAANYLLIANAIEAALHQLDIGRTYPFKHLYERLNQLPPATFASPTLRAQGAGYYSYLRNSIDGDILPDRPQLSLAVGNLVTDLLHLYDGNALSMAVGSSKTDPVSPRQVEDSLLALRPFDDPPRVGMRKQVIKLAAIWGIWPGLQLDRSFYAPARGVIRLLLSTGCLGPYTPTAPSTSVRPEDLHYVTAFAEHRIAQIVRSHLHPSIVIKLTTPATSDPDIMIGLEVDYILWSQAREADGGALASLVDVKWKREGDLLVRAKP